MRDTNTVFLTGNLTAAPDLQWTHSGKSFCPFNIAVNRSYKDASGEWQEDVDFFGCVVFGKTAEFMGQYLDKGSKVLIEGRLSQEKWEDKHTGKSKSKTKIIADKITSVGSRDRSQSNDAYKQRPEPKQTQNQPQGNINENDDVPF